MRNRFFAAALAWIFLPIVCVVSTPTLTLAAHPIVTSDVKHDTSAPLRDMAASAQVSPGAATQAPVARPTGSPIVSSRPDPVAQRPTAPLSGVTTILNFDGQSAGPFVPPDTNGAVGSTQFLQIVNVTIAVYNKANGSLELGPTDINSIWKGFGGPCEAGNGGDPIVLFDQLANRWLVSQLQFNVNFTSNQQCIAVSTSSDATGTYHRYEFDFSENLPDYPKFGVWPDAYYNSSNTFVRGTRFIGAQACAFDRAAMLLGKTATKICFQNPPTVASLLPSDLDGHTLPPSGQPNFFVDIADATHLDIFQFHADFTNPLKSSFAGPTPIAVANFNEICNRAIVLACIPEPSPGEKVDGLGDRLMYRLAYSNFGGHESLVVNHTVHGGPLAGVRWYEIRSPGSSPFVFQQGTVVDPTTSL